MPFFGWPPFRLVALDADTGKPIDPNIGMRVKREFYDIKKDKNGKKMIIAHKTSSHGTTKDEGKGGSEDIKKGVNVKGNEVKKNGSGGGNAGSGGGGGGGGCDKMANKAPFTAEEDERLKKMKAEGKTWRQIATEMHRPQGQLKNRNKEINPDGDGGEGYGGGKKDGNGKRGGGDNENNNNNAQNKEESKKDKKAAKEDQPEKEKKEKPSNKAPSKAPSKAASNGEARFTMKEWITLQEDDMFSFGELQCLSELLMRDENQHWLRIASRFFDLTGRRVHPQDIKEKFAEISAMG